MPQTAEELHQSRCGVLIGPGRIGRPEQSVPIAAAKGFDSIRNTPDLITRKLADLHFYQLAIPAPAPPNGSFNAAAAVRGKDLFVGKAVCATCHVPPLFHGAWVEHAPSL